MHPDDCKAEDLVRLVRIGQWLSELSFSRTQPDSALKLENQKLSEDISALNDLIDDLERQLAENANELSIFRAEEGAEGEEGRVSLKRKCNTLEGQVKKLTRELQTAEELVTARDAEVFTARRELAQAKERLESINKEVVLARGEAEDLREKLTAQQEFLNTREEHEEKVDMQLQAKNRDLLKYVEDIERLAARNDELEQETLALREEVEAKAAEIGSAHNEVQHQRVTMDELDKQVDELKAEREVLKLRITDLAMQVEAGGYSDEKLIEAIEIQVGEWKTRFALKEAEIVRLREEVEGLHAELRTLKEDLSSSTPAAMQDKIHELSEQLFDMEDDKRELQRTLDGANTRIQELRLALELRGHEAKHEVSQALEAQRKFLDAQTTRAADLEKALLEERNLSADLLAKQARHQTEVVELKSRMREYEQGTWGVADAVHEIKELKAKVAYRDADITRLTRKMNDIIKNLQTAMNQNEMMRLQLGIAATDEIDLGDLKEEQQVKLEQAVGLNKAYQKEIQKLEEERLSLKAELRFQALQRGAQAVKLGLNADQLNILEQFAQRLRSGTSQVDGLSVQQGGIGGLVVTAQSESQQLILQLQQENGELKDMIRIISEGKPLLHLQQQLKQAQAAASGVFGGEGSGGGSGVRALADLETERAKSALLGQDLAEAQNEIQRLARLLEAADAEVEAARAEREAAKASAESLRVALKGKRRATIAERDAHLSAGRLAERAGDVSAGKEAAKRAAEAEARAKEIEEEEAKVKAELQARQAQSQQVARVLLNDTAQSTPPATPGGPPPYSPMPVPPSSRRFTVASPHNQQPHHQQQQHQQQQQQQMAAAGSASSLQVSRLQNELAMANEQLLAVLDQLDQKKAELKACHADLLTFRESIQSLSDEQALLFRQHLALRESSAQAAKKAEEQLVELHTKRQADSIRMEDMERRLALRSQGEMATAMEQAAREATVLRISEMTLQRRLDSALESDRLARKQLAQLRGDHIAMATALQDRLREVWALKTAAESRANMLSRRCETSVPGPAHQALRVKHENLGRMYAIALERERELLSRFGHAAAAAQAQSAGLPERCVLLEGQVKALERKVSRLVLSPHAQDPSVEAMAELAARAGECDEAKRQMAAAQRAADSLRASVAEADRRVDELRRQQALLEGVAAELREAATSAVPREEADRALQQAAAAEGQAEAAEANLRKYKEIASIASSQTAEIVAMHEAERKELASLHESLAAMGSQSDEATALAKLQYEVISLRVSEASLRVRAQALEDDKRRASADLYRAEAAHARDKAVLHMLRDELAQRIAEQERQAQAVRSELAASVTNDTVASMTAHLRRALEHNLDLQRELGQTKREAVAARSQAMMEADRAVLEAENLADRLRVKEEAIETLWPTGKDSDPQTVDTLVSKKIAEWSARLLAMQVNEHKLTRKLKTQGDQVEAARSAAVALEAEMAAAEEAFLKGQLGAQQEADELRNKIYDLELEVSRARREQWSLGLQRAEDSDQVFQVAAAAATQQQQQQQLQQLQQAPLFRPGATLETLEARFKESISENRDSFKKAVAENAALRSRLAEAEGELKQAVADKRELVRQVQLLQKGVTHYPDDGRPVVSDLARGETEAIGRVKEVAEKTFESLQNLLAHKTELVAKYQRMLGEQRAEFEAEKERDSAEILRLTAKIAEEGGEQMARLREGLARVDRLPLNLPAALPTHEIEDALADRDTQVARLRTQLTRREAEADELREAVIKRASEIAHLEEQLAQERAKPPPSKEMQRLIKDLRVQLEAKEVEHKRLRKALDTLKADLVDTAERTAALAMAGGEEESKFRAVVAKAVERDTAALTKKAEALAKRLAELQTAHDQHAAKEAALVKEVAKARRETEDYKVRCDRQAEELKRLARKLDQMAQAPPQQPHHHHHQQQQQAGDHAAAVHGLEQELQNRIRVLEVQLAQAKGGVPEISLDLQQLEMMEKERRQQNVNSMNTRVDSARSVASASASVSASHPAPTSLAKAAETERRLRKRVDNLNLQLQDKAARLDAVDKEHREAVAKLQGEIALLREKEAARGPAMELGQLGTVAELRERLFALEQANTDLKAARDEAYEKRIAKLQHDLDHAQREWDRLARGGSQVKDPLDHHYQYLVAREAELLEAALAKDLLCVELRISSESNKLKVKRLEERLEELTLLGRVGSGKATKSSGGGGGGGGAGGGVVVAGASSSSSSSKKQVDRRVAELEDVVAAMTKVTEDLQTENQMLKRGGRANAKFNSMVKELKAAREEVANVLATNEALRKERAPLSAMEAKAEASAAHARDVEGSLKAAHKSIEALKKTIASQAVDLERLEAEGARLKAQLTDRAAAALSKRDNFNRAESAKDLAEENRRLRASLGDAERELARVTKELEAARAELAKEAKAAEDTRRTLGYYEKELELLQKAPPREDPREIARLTAEVAMLTTHITTLQAERDVVLAATTTAEGAADDDFDDPDPAELRALVRRGQAYPAVVTQRDNLVAESIELKKLLARFDDSFFEELAKIRKEHREAIEINAAYEAQLRDIAIKHGVRVSVAALPGGASSKK